MTPSKLRESINAIPSGPFQLRVSDGSVVRVPHRDYLAISPEGEMVGLWDDHSAFKFIDTHHITSVEMDRPGALGGRKTSKGKAGKG